MNFCQDVAAILRAAKTRPVRTMVEFAEQEIWIPEGKHVGERLRWDTQPVQRLLLEELDRGYWLEVYVTAPSQCGKTFIAFNVPIAYYIAELCETLVVGVPDGNMTNDKWVKEIRPIFEASDTLRALLPVSGPGSKGGKVRDYIEMTSKAFLRFMNRGGDDTAKAGYTARIVIATEAAGWSHGTETSQEAEPIQQLQARQLSFDREDKPLLLVEGTSTVKQELPWSAYPFTTMSRVVSPCPHCGGWIGPERDHLTGWSEAGNAEEAYDVTSWCCPECGELITDEQRRESVRHCKLIHDGQEIDKRGNITGKLPPTRKLWFRWSAWHNMNVSTGTLGAEEWQANQHEPETEQRENAEKRMCQFRFAVPYEQLNNESYNLTVEGVAAKKTKLPLGVIPENCTHLAVAVDVGEYRCYYSLLCGLDDGRLYIPRYDSFTVPSREMDFEIALPHALNDFWKSTIEPGFAWAGHSEPFFHNECFIDAGDGDVTDLVFGWVKSITGGARKGKCLPIVGRGTAQMQKIYSAPVKRSKHSFELGDGWHVGLMMKGKTKQRRGWACTIDVDKWKTRVHRSLSLEAHAIGSMSLYSVAGDGHKRFARHLTNEHKEKQFKAGRGEVDVWVRTGQQAWLDTTVYARVALERAGWSVAPETATGD